MGSLAPGSRRKFAEGGESPKRCAKADRQGDGDGKGKEEDGEKNGRG